MNSHWRRLDIPMEARVTDQASFILRRREWRNSSLILDVFTRDHGCVRLLAKGARRSSAQAQYQPFVMLNINWSGRQELKTLTGIEGQVLPIAAELDTIAGFSADPLAEQAATVAPNLIQKYSKRALVIATPGCAVHCRYCFRRHFPYAQLPQAESAWDRPLAALAADDSIQEVILSGGDPLMWVDRRLATLARRISAIGHIRRLRVHTRLPVMIPGRVTDTLVDWLAGGRQLSRGGHH